MGTQSYAHTEYLVEGIGAQGSGTAEERQAADYVKNQLKTLDIPFEEQPFRSPASAWRPFAANFALTLIGALIAPLFMPASAIMAARSSAGRGAVH